jgi:hypothetical protein
MNQYMAQRLHPFVSYYQDDWSKWLPIIDFAQVVLPHDLTGLAPAYVDGGYVLRTSFDWQAASSPQNLNVNREEA